MKWIISKSQAAADIVPVKAGNCYCYFESYRSFNELNLHIAVDGYVIPRMAFSGRYGKYRGNELVCELFKDFGWDFIRKIKGSFTLVIIHANEVRVYNDTHGQRKYFSWVTDNDFIFSNRINPVRSYANTGPDMENLAIFCLLDHFVLDMTSFKGVKQSMPASELIFRGKVYNSRYWLPEELTSQQVEEHGRDYYSSEWAAIIDHYITATGVKSGSVTLTGGCDSRMVLAGLANTGLDLKAFSYGNPASFDVILARDLSEKLGIRYSNHNVTNPSAEWIRQASNSITAFGESLVNIHRAHRLQAAVEEKKENPGSEFVFTGLMGGEYLRGVDFDGYIITSYFKERQRGRILSEMKRTGSLLKERFINPESLDWNVLHEKLSSLPFDDQKKDSLRRFLLAFYIYGSAHHYQDTAVYNSEFSYVFNPFMDIDFLEMIARSPFISFNHNRRLHNLLWASRFQVMITHMLLPQVSDVQYNKKGRYTASDMCERKANYITRRLKSTLKEKKYPPNFSYGEWMYDFVFGQYKDLHPAVEELFDKTALMTELSKGKLITIEKEWHRFTNPINLSNNLK